MVDHARRNSPQISSLFVTVFDKKVGYKVAWHRELSGISIDGVEFQSLPSGLHGVKEDLVYFVHEDYMGVSAFVQAEADESHRNADFVSVGVLLPLTQDRGAQGWLLSQSVRELAAEIVGDLTNTKPLEEFWTTSQQEPSQRGPTPGSSHLKHSAAQELSRRANSEEKFRIDKALNDERPLPAEHPSLATGGVLDLFGPLIFPIYRAALLRKRVLFLGSAPVHRHCNLVYILSAFALAADDGNPGEMPPVPEELSRIRPLFNVGIHDIPILEQYQGGGKGWLACTTDDILRDKRQLYDILVELPSCTDSGSQQRWPRILRSDGSQIKATQRDLRRYKRLRLELRRMRLELRRQATSESTSSRLAADDESVDDTESDDRQHLLQRTVSVYPALNPTDRDGSAATTEPATWAALAYSGIMWCSAANEASLEEAAEIEIDRSLLDDLPDIDAGSTTDDNSEDDKEQARRHKAQASAMIIGVYFLRLTILLLKTTRLLVNESSEDASARDAVQHGKVVVDAEDMGRMGLDIWSDADKAFVVEAMKTYFGREATVHGQAVDICGLRLC